MWIELEPMTKPRFIEAIDHTTAVQPHTNRLLMLAGRESLNGGSSDTRMLERTCNISSTIRDTRSGGHSLTQGSQRWSLECLAKHVHKAQLYILVDDHCRA